MTKKILAVLLSALICLSIPFSAGAASGRTQTAAEFVSAIREDLQTTQENLSSLKNIAVGLLEDVSSYADNISVTGKKSAEALTDVLLNVYEDAGATQVDLTADGDTDVPAEAEEDPEVLTEETYTVSEIVRLIRKYMFIKIDDSDAVAALIADSCDFSYALVNGSDGTLYIRVDIENNPEIFNYDVFRKLVEKLYERQNEEMLSDRYGQIDYVMSYEHIAGELALHAILFAATANIIAVTNTASERILKLYNEAAQADLNIDEARVPSQLITLAGKLIINVFKFNVLKLFSFLA